MIMAAAMRTAEARGRRGSRRARVVEVLLRAAAPAASTWDESPQGARLSCRHAHGLSEHAFTRPRRNASKRIARATLFRDLADASTPPRGRATRRRFGHEHLPGATHGTMLLTGHKCRAQEHASITPVADLQCTPGQGRVGWCDLVSKRASTQRRGRAAPASARNPLQPKRTSR